MDAAANTVAAPAVLARSHARRLREIYRSAGWPCQDTIEIELLAAGLVRRVDAANGHFALQVTDTGLLHLAQALARNRAALSEHEALVERVAREMGRAGRIAWRGLSLRALVPAQGDAPAQWVMAMPDVFSIRNTTVEAYAEPVVHEIKVRRADLLGDLRRWPKRAAYLDLGACWYVLGCDTRGRCIADPSEIPPECGVMVVQQGRLAVARPAPQRAVEKLPFQLWMALAKATPVAGLDEEAQGLL